MRGCLPGVIAGEWQDQTSAFTEGTVLRGTPPLGRGLTQAVAFVSHCWGLVVFCSAIHQKEPSQAVPFASSNSTGLVPLSRG